MGNRISRWSSDRCTRWHLTHACPCPTPTWLAKWEAISRCVRTRWTLLKFRSSHPKIIPLDQKRIRPWNLKSPKRKGTAPRSHLRSRDPRRSSTAACCSSSTTSMAPSWSSKWTTRMSRRSTPSWKRRARMPPSRPRKIKFPKMKTRTRMSPPISQSTRMRRKRVRMRTKSILVSNWRRRHCLMIGARNFTIKKMAPRMVT